jgi:hypothetical protein
MQRPRLQIMQFRYGIQLDPLQRSISKPLPVEQIIRASRSAEKVLIFNSSYVNLIQNVNMSMRHLKVLKLINIPFKIPSTIYFDNLNLIKVYRIHSSKDIDNLVLLIRCTENLRLLEFTCFGLMIEFDENFLSKIATMSKKIDQIIVYRNCGNEQKRIVRVESTDTTDGICKTFALDSAIFEEEIATFTIREIICESKITTTDVKSISIDSLKEDVNLIPSRQQWLLQ